MAAKTSNLNYSVPFYQGSKYHWNTPAGMWITSGKHTNSINLDVDYQSGYLEVTETDVNGCQLEPCKLWIEVKE